MPMLGSLDACQQTPSIPTIFHSSNDLAAIHSLENKFGSWSTGIPSVGPMHTKPSSMDGPDPSSPRAHSCLPHILSKPQLFQIISYSRYCMSAATQKTQTWHMNIISIQVDHHYSSRWPHNSILYDWSILTVRTEDFLSIKLIETTCS